MAKIFEALKVLKAKIQSVHGSSMKPVKKGFEDKTFSQKNFVDKNLKPAIKPTSDLDLATDAEMNEYTNKVIQAVWNIAHYASGGYLSAGWHKNEIKAAFHYLDTELVPKVINNKIYQVSKMLQEFFEESLNEESLQEIPEVGGARQSIGKILNRLFELLNKRIAVYEAHLPQELAKNVEWVKFKRESLESSNIIGSQLNNNNNVLAGIRHDNAVIIDAELTTNTLGAESRFEIIDAARKHHEAAVATLKQAASSWIESIRAKKPPAKVMSSDFITILASDKPSEESLRAHWVHLYNSKNPRVYPNNIAGDLEASHEKLIQELNQSQKDMELSLKSQKELLTQRIDDGKLFNSLNDTYKFVKLIKLPNDDGNNDNLL